MAYARADGVHRKAGALLLRRLDIAEICNHGADAGSHQQQTLARVGAQVENIGCIMQQRGRTRGSIASNLSVRSMHVPHYHLAIRICHMRFYHI